MTDGDAKTTDSWIRDHEATYAYGYDHAYALIGAFNVPSYPYVVLVSPGGNVAWQGPAHALEENDVKAHLTGALETPLWSWPQEAATVRTAVLAGRYADAIRLAAALEEGESPKAPGVAGWVETLVKAALAGAEEARAAGDYLSAAERATRLEENLRGTSHWLRAVKLVDALSEDAHAQAVREAQEELRKIRRASFSEKETLKARLERLDALARAWAKEAFLSAQIRCHAGFLRAVLRRSGGE